MNKDITMEVAAGKVAVASPYNEAFVKRARRLGGEWDGRTKMWVFDERDIDGIKEAVAECYGHYFDAGVELVDIRIACSKVVSGRRKPIYCGPREVARAWGRDSGARLSDGVVQIQGNIDSGGSVKNWRTDCSADSIFEVRDFPRVQLDKIDTDIWTVEIVSESKSEGDEVDEPEISSDVRAERIAAMEKYLDNKPDIDTTRSTIVERLFDIAHGREVEAHEASSAVG